MRFLIGSYKENIYEVTIDKKNGKFLESKVLIEASKPSYLSTEYEDLSYIHMIDNSQYVKIGNHDINLGSDTSCHISFDKVNNLFYSSHYHTGSLFVLNKDKLIKRYSYTDHSHIHYAMFIPNLNLLGVCDLGDNKFFLYNVINNELVLNSEFSFNENTGPRHFVYHKTLPLIYVVMEHSAEIVVLSYQDNTLEAIQTVFLPSGMASAIRISKNSKFIYAADRKSNTISSYEIIDDGFLIPLQVISTNGEHPRDFNLSLDEKFLVAANMNSNTLTLYERDLESGSLILLDENFSINAPAVVIPI